MTTREEPILEANLTVSYRNGPEILRDLHLRIAPRELLGLAGQSGSGKSTLALALMGLLDRKRAHIRGNISFKGRELTRLGEKEWRSIRGREIAFIFQSAQACLTPTMRLGELMREAWMAHSPESGRWRDEACCVLEALGLPGSSGFFRLFPGELSVGMAQRFLAAMAVLHRPALLIADEPTSALDLITQSDLLNLLGRFNSEFGTAILLITHDLSAAARFCHRLAILHEGTIVEEGVAGEIIREPRHAYTRRLVGAMGCGPADSLTSTAEPELR